MADGAPPGRPGPPGGPQDPQDALGAPRTASGPPGRPQTPRTPSGPPGRPQDPQDALRAPRTPRMPSGPPGPPGGPRTAAMTQLIKAAFAQMFDVLLTRFSPEKQKFTQGNSTVTKRGQKPKRRLPAPAGPHRPPPAPASVLQASQETQVQNLQLVVQLHPHDAVVPVDAQEDPGGLSVLPHDHLHLEDWGGQRSRTAPPASRPQPPLPCCSWWE